jgi:2-dehydro-3-deoxyphosphooctonate aldolase (KDO 8-P synthase)
MKPRAVEVNGISIGAGRPLALIAGPCVVENSKSALRHAHAIKKIARRVGLPFIYKSSYDKANRSSLASFRGLGLEMGLEILARVKAEAGVPILTDVHSAEEAERARTCCRSPPFCAGRPTCCWPPPGQAAR